jgi:hypothetical protein
MAPNKQTPGAGDTARGGGTKSGHTNNNNGSPSAGQAPSAGTFLAASDSDRRFFKRRPSRRFRLRRAFSGERRMAALAGSALQPLQPGCRDFVIIEQIAPGVRIRVGFAAASDLETDFGDEEIERLLEDEPSLRGELARIARIMGALL